MSFRIGLTGSIGTGKSTTAAMFADLGVPIWDADATVHRLYEPGNAGALAVSQLFPDAIGKDGAVRRDLLRSMAKTDQTVLTRLNAAIHPLVAADRAAFVAKNLGAPILLFDMPLLFETGAEREFGAVVVVTVPESIQKQRVLERGLSPAEFDAIRARQMPDLEKRARADYVIATTSLETARAEVKAVLADINRRIARDA